MGNAMHRYKGKGQLKQQKPSSDRRGLVCSAGLLCRASSAAASTAGNTLAASHAKVAEARRHLLSGATLVSCRAGHGRTSLLGALHTQPPASAERGTRVDPSGAELQRDWLAVCCSTVRPCLQCGRRTCVQH